VASTSDIERIQLRAQLAGFDELYSGITQALPPTLAGQIGGGAALRLKNPIEFGKEFYQKRLRPSMISAVCGKLSFCQNRHLYDTGVKVVGMVADAATEVVGKTYGLPEGSGEAAKLVVEVSAAVIKEGLNALCDCAEE
jgi:hypothetical protein